jgi:hypothetical protein
MSNEKPVDQQTAPDTQTVTRDEFMKVTQQADSIASILRKEREASAQKMTALEARLAEIAEKLEANSKPKDAPKADQTAAELKALRAQLDSEKTEREKERMARMQQEERTALSQALTSRGVTGPHLKGAMALLYDAEKRIVRDDAGLVSFRIQRNGFEEVSPLERALDEWLNTDDGKTYMPPRQAQGSGTQPGQPSRSGSTDGKMTKAEAAAMLPILLRQ